MILSKLAGPVIGTALALSLIQVVERRLPVVAFMNAADGQLIADTYTVSVTGYKIRDCIVIKGTFSGWYLDGGLWRETSLTFPDDPTPESTRPSGLSAQDFGLWRWGSLPDGTEKVRGTVMHNCDGQAVLTTIGPFRIEGA